MILIKKLASVAVLAIGVYMLATNWGAVTPPMLSGLAFVLLGGMHTYKVFGCCKMK